MLGLLRGKKTKATPVVDTTAETFGTALTKSTISVPLDPAFPMLPEDISNAVTPSYEPTLWKPIPRFEYKPQALVHDHHTGLPIEQVNATLPARPSKMEALKKISRYYAPVSSDAALRRLAKGIFEIIVVWQEAGSLEIPDNVTFRNFESDYLTLTYCAGFGTGFYIGHGRVMTNAHVVMWPTDLPETVVNRLGHTVNLEARIYLLHGSGELRQGTENRRKARVELICPTLVGYLGETSSGLLREGEIHEMKDDWAILAIDATQDNWPKAKYAARPSVAQGHLAQPCTLIGVNQRGPGGVTARIEAYMASESNVKIVRDRINDLQPDKISAAQGLCMLRGQRGSSQIVHNISTLGGSSGSPIFVQIEDSYRVIAIHAAGDVHGTFRMQSLNGAVPISTELCHDVVQWLRSIGAPDSILGLWEACC